MTVLRHDTSVPPSVVEDALRALAKAFSAVQLYLPNNPQRAQRLLEARQAFSLLWRQGESVEIEVRENAFRYGNAVVYQDAERGSDALPWLLYRDGIRGLTFAPGFEERELESFLGLVQAARSANTDDDDLVTLLWVADYQCLTYRFLDSFGGDIGTTPGESETEGRPTLHVYDESAEAEQTSSSFIRMEDFDGALYFLDQREIATLQAELERAYADDPRRVVLDSLLDLIDVGLPEEARREAFEALDTLVVELLTAAQYEMVAYALRETAKAAKHPGLDPELVEALGAIAHRLSEPRAMSQLLLAIDDSARTPAMSLLEELFRELRPSALEPLVLWLGTAGASPARAAVERASLRLAGAHLAELARLLEHPETGVVKGALKIATQLATPATVPGLAKLLRNDDVRMRLDAVNALANVGSPGALQALERAIDDADREVRVAIYRTIAARKHAAVLPRLLAVLRAKETRATDLGEKMALFEAFGSLCGDAGVAELDAILNSKGLLGAKEPPEFRACAARALGLIGTPAAFASLQKASDTKEVVVRSAVLRAMRDGA
ncbi:MAG: HEAT repeat domain-containing protein [Gemmatimonadaceae bacterium]|nr:HEAT repeat domain-containing protein [Gemmatimonadaceae bacterium]